MGVSKQEEVSLLVVTFSFVDLSLPLKVSSYQSSSQEAIYLSKHCCRTPKPVLDSDERIKVVALRGSGDLLNAAWRSNNVPHGTVLRVHGCQSTCGSKKQTIYKLAA